MEERTEKESVNEQSHYVTLKLSESILKLIPGPVYLFHLQLRFLKETKKKPSLARILRYLKKTDISGVSIHGRKMTDPRILKYRYRCRISYEKRISRFKKRSPYVLALRKLERQKGKISLNEDRIRRSFDRVQRRLDIFKAYDDSNSADDTNRPSLPDGFQIQKEKLEVQSKLLLRRLADFKKHTDRLIEYRTKEAEKLAASLETCNLKLLQAFSDAEKETFRHLRTRDVIKLSKALEKGDQTSVPWQDYNYRVCPLSVRWIRPYFCWTLKGKKGSRDRTDRRDDIPLTEALPRVTMRTTDNYRIGVLGSKIVKRIVNSNETIGRNLTRIIMTAESCSSDEAYSRALTLLRLLGIPDPEEVLDTRVNQYINEDYHYRILLAYALAFRPEILVIDMARLRLRPTVFKNLLHLMRKFQETMNLIVCVVDTEIRVSRGEDTVLLDIDGSGHVVPKAK